MTKKMKAVLQQTRDGQQNLGNRKQINEWLLKSNCQFGDCGTHRGQLIYPVQPSGVSQHPPVSEMRGCDISQGWCGMSLKIGGLLDNYVRIRPQTLPQPTVKQLPLVHQDTNRFTLQRDWRTPNSVEGRGEGLKKKEGGIDEHIYAHETVEATIFPCSATRTPGARLVFPRQRIGKLELFSGESYLPQRKKNLRLGTQ